MGGWVVGRGVAVAKNIYFQLVFRCVQGRSGCVNTSSLMSRSRSRASGDQDFFEKEYFPRTSGNDLNGILTLSDRQTDASGAHFGPFSLFSNFFFI